MVSILSALLSFCTTYGRWILACSLVLGLLGGPLAALIKPHIEIFVALLLFLACLRVGPKQAVGAVHDIKSNLVYIIVLQITLPVCISLVLWFANIQHILGLALVLLTAAPALSGSPHLATLLGIDPAPALRQVVVGTALLPITVIPVFLLLPELGNILDIMHASFWLIVVIFSAAFCAFIIRLTLLKELSVVSKNNVDGLSTLLLAIVVIGLMTAIQDEVLTNPLNLAATLIVAIIANFGLQVSATNVLKRSSLSKNASAIGITAGNRNIALFLTALPATTTDSLLLFIACYQIPMYLTPIVLSKFYQSRSTLTPNIYNQ